MATIVPNLDVPSSYKDQQYKQTAEQLTRDLQTSATLYVGNLSFYTTEEQIHELFSKCGEIKRIIMGLDRNNKTPCGFCFVEYYHRKDALACMKYINSTKLDERIIRTDLDPGFREGRQFGRGKSGGQVRDEYRQEFDAGRGGWGHIVRAKLEKERGEKLRENYEAIKEIPSGADEYRSRTTSGKKRARDDDGETSGSKRPRENNPRFRDERSDDDDDTRQ